MIEEIAAILLGCILGVFSGLAPGIHVNTIAIAAGAFATKQDFNFALLVVSMTITHSFLDFIPSILLGAPDAENFLSALPGHRMLLKGKAFRAIKLAVSGGVFGIIIAIALLPAYGAFVIKTSGFLFKLVPIILIASLLLVVFSEKGIKKKAFALLVVALSGALGLLSLGNNSFEGNLFSLVTGFFGTSTIVFSLKQKQKIRWQKTKKTSLQAIPALKASAIGTIASSMVALFPAIGPSQAAFIVKKFSGKISTEKYLVVLGSISTASTVFSFFMLQWIGKARTGTAAAISEIIISQQEKMPLVLAAIFIATCFSVFAADFISRRAVNEMQRFDYRKTNIAVLAIMVFLVLFFAGTNGLFLLCVSTAIGLVALGTKTKRTNCMAFLILPTIAYYLKQFA